MGQVTPRAIFSVSHQLKERITLILIAPYCTNTMARSIESVHQFEHSQPYGLPKDKTVVRCHDGAVYEFEKANGRKTARLVRGFQPDGSMSHTGSSSRLPAAVEETASMLLTGWSE